MKIQYKKFLTLVLKCILHSLNEPGSNKARKVSFLVTVDATVGLQDEALLFTKGSNDRSTLQCLTEVAVDW